MSSITLKQVDDLCTPDNPDFFSTASASYERWISRHQLLAPVSYTSEMPTGLHIASGCADIETGAPSLGKMVQRTAVINILYTPQDFDEKFETRTGKGHGFSGGVYFPGTTDDYPEELFNILEIVSKNEPFMRDWRVPHHLARRLCEPVESFYQGYAFRLANEAKVFELIAAAASVLSGKESESIGVHIGKAKQVRDIIESDLGNVPTLSGLASLAATNVRSLTQSFRETYGCSIQEYVSEKRMQSAIHLLEEGLTVTEVAQRVGYSLGHFSEKFRSYYGFTASSVVPPRNIPDS